MISNYRLSKLIRKKEKAELERSRRENLEVAAIQMNICPDCGTSNTLTRTIPIASAPYRYTECSNCNYKSRVDLIKGTYERL